MNSELIARGGVLVKLDRERVIFYSMEATWLLIQKYGMSFVSALYVTHEVKGKEDDAPANVNVELKDMDALAFFLWVGLREDAKQANETLTLVQVQDFFTPYTFTTIFSAVVQALMRDASAPVIPGKVGAAQAGPKSAAQKIGQKSTSTLTKRKGSRSPR